MSSGATENPSSSSSSGGGGGPCGACKFLRRKCVPGCVFAPYFDSDQGAGHFAAVHKVFGASNVSKLLLHIPVHKRLDAVVTICYEAQARLRDPVYGCVAHIFALQQQMVNLQAELSYLQAHLATLELPSPPPLAPSSITPSPMPLSIADLPLSSSTQLSYDLPSFFDPMLVPNPTWTTMDSRAQPHQTMDPRHLGGINLSSMPSGELHALARQAFDRQRPPPPSSEPCLLPKRE